MAKLNTVAPNTTHRVLIYGPPKSGKSQLAGTLAKKYNVYWFDCERGYEVLYKLPEDQQANIELLHVPDTKSYPMAFETLLKMIKGTPVEICEAHGKVACPACKKEGAPVVRFCGNELGPNDVLVIDSLTQVVNSVIAKMTQGKSDEYKLERDDWGNLGKFMDLLLGYVQNANFNIVAISHETTAEREDGTEVLVPVAGTRNFSRNSGRYFDHVIYTTVRGGKHIAGSSTTFKGGILTGSRNDVALEHSDSADLCDMFAGISANKAQITQRIAARAVAAPQKVAQQEAKPAAASVSALSKLGAKG